MMVGVAVTGVGAMVLMAFFATLVDAWRDRTRSKRGGHGARGALGLVHGGRRRYEGGGGVDRPVGRERRGGGWLMNIVMLVLTRADRLVVVLATLVLAAWRK